MQKYKLKKKIKCAIKNSNKKCNGVFDASATIFFPRVGWNAFGGDGASWKTQPLPTESVPPGGR